MMQNFGGVPESKISEAKLCALQSTGYNGIQFPKLEEVPSEDTSEEDVSLIDEEGEVEEQIELENLQDIGDGYLLNKSFAELLEKGPQNKVEQALFDDAITYLEPHEIEDAIRGKKSLYQVRDTITNSIIRIQVMQIMRWEKIYRLQQQYGHGEHKTHIPTGIIRVTDIKLDGIEIMPEVCLIKDKDLYLKK